MKTSQKKQLAEELFMHGNYTQKELAERVGVTENTMGKWVKPWRKLLAASKTTKQEVLQRIDKAINDIFVDAENEGRKLNSADYDAISKLNKTRESIDREMGLSVIIEVFQEYNSFLMVQNSDLCKQNNEYQDQFVNLKASGGK